MIYLKSQLFGLQMKEGDNVLSHCNHALGIQSKLMNINEQMKDVDVAICILKSLPKSFDHLKTDFELSNKNLSTEDLIHASPYEQVYNQVPDIKHIRIIGCMFYTLTQHELRQKWDHYS